MARPISTIPSFRMEDGYNKNYVILEDKEDNMSKILSVKGGYQDGKISFSQDLDLLKAFDEYVEATPNKKDDMIWKACKPIVKGFLKWLAGKYLKDIKFEK